MGNNALAWNGIVKWGHLFDEFFTFLLLLVYPRPNPPNRGLSYGHELNIHRSSNCLCTLIIHREVDASW